MRLLEDSDLMLRVRVVDVSVFIRMIITLKKLPTRSFLTKTLSELYFEWITPGVLFTEIARSQF